MKDQNSKPVSDMPEQSKVNNFRRSLWSEKTNYNKEAPWVKILEREYCVDAQLANCEITDNTLEKVIGRMANDKLRKDLVTRLWIKQLPSVKHHLKIRLRNLITCQTEMTDWLIKTKTILLAKNNETKNAQNYKQIALQNAVYKMYT